MKYRAIQLRGKGGLDQLRTIELPLDDPKPGELQIRVRAAGVGFTDITMRRSYDPYRPPFPFVPGYEVLGEVDTLGAGVIGFQKGQRACALTVHDAWAEYFTREADHFFPVPDGVHDGEAVALILNYVTAYQMIYRYGKMPPGGARAGQRSQRRRGNGASGIAETARRARQRRRIEKALRLRAATRRTPD